jgi:hypothetical protein
MEIGMGSDEAMGRRREETLFLACILPPSSVADDIERMRDELFAATGNYSILALPPLIALGFSTALPPKGAFGDLAGLPPGGFSLSSRILSGGSVFFRLNEEDRVHELAASCPWLDETIGFIPPYPGLFLGQGEEGRPASRIMEPRLPGRLPSWEVSEAAVLEVTFDGDRWWSSLYWEVVESAFLPRGKRSKDPEKVGKGRRGSRPEPAQTETL